MTGVHSIIAPSSADGWSQCSAWPRMNEPYANDPPTPESAEGDAAHWLACRIAMRIAGWKYPAVGDKAPNGVAIDQDMIDAAELFAEVVGAGAVHEQKVAIPGIHPVCDGTPDARRLDPLVYRIFDFKYGHRFVEMFNCKQLVAYACGVLDEIPRDQWPKWVEFVIVQPRAYHRDGPVRKWTYETADLIPLFNDLHSAAHRAIGSDGRPRPDAPATTGPACGDCRARHECTAFQAVAARLVDESHRTERYNLPPPQLGAELTYLDEALDRLKARRDGLAVQADAHIRAGRAVPGYELGEGRANERWRDDVTYDEIAGFAATFDVALGKKPELITPTQARAELKRRALPTELLDGYAIRPRGAMSLQRSSTIRAQKVFRP